MIDNLLTFSTTGTQYVSDDFRCLTKKPSHTSMRNKSHKNQFPKEP